MLTSSEATRAVGSGESRDFQAGGALEAEGCLAKAKAAEQVGPYEPRPYKQRVLECPGVG